MAFLGNMGRKMQPRGFAGGMFGGGMPGMGRNNFLAPQSGGAVGGLRQAAMQPSSTPPVNPDIDRIQSSLGQPAYSDPRVQAELRNRLAGLQLPTAAPMAQPPAEQPRPSREAIVSALRTAPQPMPKPAPSRGAGAMYRRPRPLGTPGY